MRDERKLSVVDPGDASPLTVALISVMEAKIDLVKRLIAEAGNDELDAAIVEWASQQGKDKPDYVLRWAPFVRPHLVAEQKRRKGTA